MVTWLLNANDETWTVTVPEERIISVRLPEPSLESPRGLVKSSLEKPFQFEPLRRALTPDDHIALVLDERLPQLSELISGVLDHLKTAGIDPDAVTLISPENAKQDWIDSLPDEFADVKTETHHPHDRKKLAYLAASKSGEPVYLNRTLVEADFIVVLCGHRHDSGGEGMLAPGLSDGVHQAKAATATTPDETETIWLLGTPFFVRVIEGAGGTIANVIAGFTNSSTEADRARDESWNHTIHTQPATVIVESVSDSFEDLASIIASAERVVAPEGRIVVLMNQSPALPAAMDMVKAANEPSAALKRLRTAHPDGWRSAAQWVDAASSAALFLAGPLSQDLCEELFATRIATAAELQRLLDSGGPVLHLRDAHLARVEYVKR